MVQLLHKFAVKASDSSTRLLKVIKNPVSEHLPVGCRRILMTYGAEKVRYLERCIIEKRAYNLFWEYVIRMLIRTLFTFRS